jgi:hypothetical protein
MSGWVRKKTTLRKSCVHEVINEVYLQNFSQMSATLRDDSNEHN